MRFVLAAFAAAFVVTGCAGQRWTDAGAHQVDGWWIGTESACLVGDLVCNPVIDAAKAGFQTDHPGAVVIGAVTAKVPGEYHPAIGRGSYVGEQVGVRTRTFAVLDLADGSRHVVAQICDIHAVGAGTDSSPTQTYECAVVSGGVNSMDMWRVGYEPTAEPSDQP